MSSSFYLFIMVMTSCRVRTKRKTWSNDLHRLCTEPRVLATVCHNLKHLKLTWNRELHLLHRSGKKFLKFHGLFPPKYNMYVWKKNWMKLGTMVACAPVGIACDKIGRRKTMLYLFFPLMASWLLIYFAQNISMMLIGRLIAGIS